jgi:hypothetical protein
MIELAMVLIIGIVTSLVGIKFDDWHFWAILIPAVIAAELARIGAGK